MSDASSRVRRWFSPFLGLALEESATTVMRLAHLVVRDERDTGELVSHVEGDEMGRVEGNGGRGCRLLRGKLAVQERAAF